jgi:hypothetical protein
MLYPAFRRQELFVGMGDRGRLQDLDRDSAQTVRHVLDRPRCQRHQCSALLPTQWKVRGLLGSPMSLNPTYYVAHPQMEKSQMFGSLS